MKRSSELPARCSENQAAVDTGIYYKCSALKELSLATDSNRHYIFLKINDYKSLYSQSLFLVKEKADN